MKIIFLGPPGAGKGTQAKRLEVTLGVPHIASGDIFRDIRRDKSPLAQQVRGFMDRGEYVPDELTIQLVLDRLDRPDAAAGFLLDGFPRTIGQAEALDSALAERGQRVDRVLYITAPDEVLERRLQHRVICPQCHEIYNTETHPPKNGENCDTCGHLLERRTDETPEVVRRRIAAFLAQTKPLGAYYGKRGNLVDIKGADSIDEVQSAIDRSLGLAPAVSIMADSGFSAPFPEKGALPDSPPAQGSTAPASGADSSPEGHPAGARPAARKAANRSRRVG